MSSHIARICALSFLVLGSLSGVACADEIEVKMLNTDGEGQRMLFQPGFVKAKVGDTIKFVPTEKPHNAESIPELWPEGVPTFKGPLNEEVSFKIEKPGIYGIKCMPHYGMGMIGLVVVGDELPNKAQLESYKPRGKESIKRFTELKAQVGQ